MRRRHEWKERRRRREEMGVERGRRGEREKLQSTFLRV